MRKQILAKAVVPTELGNHRWLIATVAALAGVGVACQDGPNQTYAPPSANAAFNDGRAPLPDGSVVVPAGTATNATSAYTNPDGTPIGAGGTNASEICTQAQIQTANGVIGTAPIVPANRAANLNLAGVDSMGNVTWKGLTIEEAEQINCQGTPTGDLFGTLTDLSMLWDNGAVVVEYSISTQKLDYIGVGPGLYGGAYGGTMDFTSDGQKWAHTDPSCPSPTCYSIAVDGFTPISIITNGAKTTSNLDWVDASNGIPGAIKVFDDMYRAAMATFLPTYPTEPAVQTCNQTGACIIGTFPGGAYAYFYIPALDWAMWVNPYYVPASANAINRMDLNFAQIMNYSPATPVLNLSSAGPTTIPLQLAASGPACQLNLGGPNGATKYSDFIANCVQTATDPNANTSETLELFSDISHDEETFQFNISGVDVSFANTRLGPTQTVLDPPPGAGCGSAPADLTNMGCPEAPDTAFELNVDQSTLGLIANDWTFDSNNLPVLHDLHGIGALYNDYRTISINNLEAEVCANVPVVATGAGGTGSPDGGPDGGAADAGVQYPPPTSGALPAVCAYWSSTPLVNQIQNCLAPRDSSGILTGDPTQFQAVGCTGMENMLSSDITTVDDPINVGPIVTQINPALSLGMKMGHQQASWCVDAMSRAQIAAQSYTVTCPGGASACAPPTSPTFTQLCPGGAGNCLSPGGLPFACPGQGTCDPTAGTCAAGVPTCTNSPGTNPVPLTVAQVDLIGSVGIGGYLLNTTGAAGGPAAPAGTEVVLALPYVCSGANILPQSHAQAVNFIGGGNTAVLPVDIQDNRFFFKQYGFALIQTLEATDATGKITMPVAGWGPPDLTGAMPVQINDLFFDSNGDGQFETMEYVDRRFVCPDGANNCAPPGSTGFTCPAGSCAVGDATCTTGPTCTASEFSQPPLDISFGADVKDGIQNAYDFNRYLYRGETALYQMIQPTGYATAQASNALLSNTFGSALINNVFGGVPPGFFDLTGQPINPTDYPNAAPGNPGPNFAGTPLSLSFGQAGSSPLVIAQTFEGAQQAQVQYPVPTAISATGSALGLVPWVPNQSGNGFNEALFGNSTLNTFVQSASIDFTGITTTALMDYNLIPSGANGALGLEVLASESQDFLGDVFMCYDPANNPQLLAVRMYTPTLAVLNWLNQEPGSYSLCGIVVRWSPFDNYVQLIESTTYGVRLQVTQGGGLGRIVGATVYVPNLPVIQ